MRAVSLGLAKMARITYLLLFSSLLLHSSCEIMKGYHFLHSVENIYKMHNKAMSWEKAKQTCSEEGAILFYPEHQIEADTVLAYANEIGQDQYIHIWIGMYATIDRIFKTIDGVLSTQVYNMWNANEPNNADDSEYCVEFHSKGLNDVKCSAERPFICKKTVEGVKGPPGPPGPRGTPGPKGDKGNTGSTGHIGVPGVPGPKGVQGILGPKGHPGDPGPKGDQGVGQPGRQGSQGQKGVQGAVGPKGHPGDPGPKGDQGTSGQAGRQGSQGQKGVQGAVGPKGHPGEPGPKGDQGTLGEPGPRGFQGQKGDQGAVGFPGMPGLPGIVGPMGPQGLSGLPGLNGQPGLSGYSGIPGIPGSPGIPGAPGMPGGYFTASPVVHISDTQRHLEAVVPQLGSEERPSTAICKFISASADKEVPAPDPYWVMEEEKFPVKCDKETNTTCLILRHNDTKWISENRFSIGNVPEGLWLSHIGFSLSRFNTVTYNQLHWLKEQSMTVRQTIRLYFLNTSFENMTLQMLNDNDVLFDQNPSARTPMRYTVEGYKDDTVEVHNETWKYVDLVIIDRAKRLPVVDFHVNHEPKEHVYISLQLRELCFG